MRNATLAAESGLSLPPDSYVYCIAAVDQALVAISSDDSLRAFDRQTLQILSGGIIEKIHSSVTCLAASPNAVFTAGRDGFIRAWDLRTGKWEVEIQDATRASILSMAIGNEGTVVAAGSELTQAQATVQVWDYRYPTQTPVVKYAECHNDDVTQLSYHPTQPSYLLSGSTDGLVNISNTTISDEDDSLIQVFNHGASVAHAGFLSESAVYALSHDESFSIYHIDFHRDDGPDGEVPDSTAFGDLRTRFSCEYIIDMLPGGGGAVLGAGRHSKSTVDLIPFNLTTEWGFHESKRINLPGAHGEDIVRTIHVDNNAATVFTGGEDGKVKAWVVTTEPEEPNQIGPTRHKKRRGSHVDGKHHKPY